MDGKEKVLQNYDAQNGERPHWKIYYGYQAIGSQLCASTEVLDDNLDAVTSKQKLSEALDRLTPGEYLIQFKLTPTANNNLINQRFKIGYGADTSTANPNTQQPAMKGYLSPEQHNELLQAKIGTLKAEMNQKAMMKEMQELLQEMKEVKKEAGNNNFGAIIKGAKEIIQELKGMKAGEMVQAPTRMAAISGPKAQPDERTAQLQELYKQAMDEWGESEGGGVTGAENFMIQVYCLNEYRKANPSVWANIKPEIMKMAEKISAQPEKTEETK